MLFFFGSLLLASLFSVVAACGGNDDEHPPRNVVGVAQSDASFSVLVEAINAADLATTLSSPGPCTVFVPTNDAFAALLTEWGALLANKHQRTRKSAIAATDLLTSNGVIHVIDKVILPKP